MITLKKINQFKHKQTDPELLLLDSIKTGLNRLNKDVLIEMNKFITNNKVNFKESLYCMFNYMIDSVDMKRGKHGYKI